MLITTGAWVFNPLDWLGSLMIGFVTGAVGQLLLDARYTTVKRYHAIEKGNPVSAR